MVFQLLKKYRSTVQQLSAEQLANQETAGALAEAEAERASLRDQLAELTAKLEASSLIDPASGLAQKRLEIRIKELESRLELEQTTRGRLEVKTFFFFFSTLFFFILFFSPKYILRTFKPQEYLGTVNNFSKYFFPETLSGPNRKTKRKCRETD